MVRTAWSLSGQHTGRSDIPLTPAGEQNARLLGKRLAKISEPIGLVLASPVQRARRTAEVGRLRRAAEIEPDLFEWDYGKYEGSHVGRHPARAGPIGSSFAMACRAAKRWPKSPARADRVIARVRKAGGNAILFSSGHILRVLAARWCGFDPSAGAHLLLGTASLSVLSYEHNLQEPALELWNDQSHLEK